MSVANIDDLANLSDDELMALPESTGDFIKLEDTVETEVETEVAQEPQTPVVTGTGTEGDEPPASLGSPEDEAAAQAAAVFDTEDDKLDAKAPVPTTPTKPKADDSAKAGESPAEKPKSSSATEAAESTPVDYKAAYERIFAPFKANGRQVQLTSPEEVVSLMQMGANYTQKLQALQPTLKMVRMLENNNLLSEDKIAFLIDVNRRDPAAITKLLKEGNIDPLEIDTQAEVNYKPSDTRVTDEEMLFVDTIREVNSDPKGAELVREIDRTWDDTSKKALWKEPAILKVLQQHRENGNYDKILAEMDRRKMLGDHQNKPVLEAYYATAQALLAQGKLTTTNATPKPVEQQTPAPLAQRQGQIVAQKTIVKPPSPDADKIRAAQPTKAAAQNVQADFNPLSMSDEDFEKTAHLAMRL